MKTQLCIALLALLFVATKCDWQLVWSDEFDSWDDSKWHHDTGNNGWGNNELENYTDSPDNCYIEDGNLVIQANRNDDGSYTSARINTAGSFQPSYGKFEMRAKLPTGQGIWPAFWLLGYNIGSVGWPACGEIDIMEVVGNDPNNNHGSTHAPGWDETSTYYSDSGFVDDYHTFSVVWVENYIEFFVDDNSYKVITNNDGGPFVFNNNPMFIILNLAVGGNWPGSPDGSTQFPQKFIIDYVRVYG